ncbi:MAG: class I SAM-dependent rRNA methyltransferase [Planctomycetes bacterium]|nr:class I SAM-dependent rRNA methyltransferase [Planctomycetota bacterium]
MHATRDYDALMTPRADDLLPCVRLCGDELPRGPWGYARSVEGPRGGDVEPGALVEVEDASGRFVGHALYNHNSDIALRWLSRGKKSALARPGQFLLERIAAADRLRRKTLRLQEVTDSWRIVHGEGDDLPGLIIDKLGPVLSIEYHALGFWRLRREVEAALGQLYPGHPIHARVPEAAARSERIAPRELDELRALPPAPEIDVVEHGLAFPVRPAAGHKTGWFCDQRDNRQRIAALARGRDVLDLCCNAGGFALFAARAGARAVRAVDLDEVALERAERAGRRAGLSVRFQHADAFDVLRAIAPNERPDLIVLDPHKLVANRAELESGLHRYADFNALAVGALRPGGLLATFSCSGAVDLSTFVGVVFSSARRAERDLRLLSILEAGPDHPQRPDFARSRYLKGLLLAVD